MDDMTMHAMQIMVMMIATLIGFMFIHDLMHGRAGIGSRANLVRIKFLPPVKNI